jgi:hypothetical protein
MTLRRAHRLNAALLGLGLGVTIVAGLSGAFG